MSEGCSKEEIQVGQAITDYARFLAEARDAVYRLNCDQNTASQLAAQEDKQKKELEAAKNAVADSISQTIKKRLGEINSSYDKEIGKGQDRLKKARAKREKAKNKGMKERIAEETSELREHNRELKVQMRTLFQKERVPAVCNTNFYYALYYPRGLKEFGILLLTLLICFLAVPCGIYFAIPQRKIAYLIAVYFADVLVFGGLYVMVGNRTKMRFQDALKKGRAIRNTLRANGKKIKIITRTIMKDGDEDLYDLEKYDDEIACAEQELEEITSKKKDALSTFENVTKNIISDEIAGSYKAKLDSLEQELEETARSLRKLETQIKEQNIHITDTYGPYLGKEFLEPDKISELSRLIQSGTASNITEAIEFYKNSRTEKTSAKAAQP